MIVIKYPCVKIQWLVYTTVRIVLLLDKESTFDNNFIARQNSIFLFPYGKILHFKRYKSSCVLYLCLPRAVMREANRYLLVSAIIYAHTTPQFFFFFSFSFS